MYEIEGAVVSVRLGVMDGLDLEFHVGGQLTLKVVEVVLSYIGA